MRHRRQSCLVVVHSLCPSRRITRLLVASAVVGMRFMLPNPVVSADEGLPPLARRTQVTPAVSVPCGLVDLTAFPADYSSPFAGRDWGYTTPVLLVRSAYDPTTRVLTFDLSFRPPAGVLADMREQLFRLYAANGHVLQSPDEINVKPLEVLASRIFIRFGSEELPIDEADNASTPIRLRSFLFRVPADKEDLHQRLKLDPKYVALTFRVWYAVDEVKAASAEVSYVSSLFENLRERVTRPPGGPARPLPTALVVLRDSRQSLVTALTEQIEVRTHNRGFGEGEAGDLHERATEQAQRLFAQLQPTRLVDLLKRREDAVVWGRDERKNDVAAHLQDDLLDRIEEHSDRLKKEHQVLDKLRESKTFDLDETRFFDDVREKLKAETSVDVVGLFGGEVDLSRDYSKLAEDQRKRVRDFKQAAKDASSRDSVLHDRHDQIKEGQIRASLSIPKDLDIFVISAGTLGVVTGSAFRTDEIIRTGKVSLDTTLPLGPIVDELDDHNTQVGDVKFSAAPGDQGSSWYVGDGRSLPVRDFPALFRKLGRTYCWFADGRPHVHEPDLFCLPDYRGVALTGHDDMGTGSRGIDAGRGLGMFQQGGVPEHCHDNGTLTVDTSHRHVVRDVYRIQAGIFPLLAGDENAVIAGYPYQGNLGGAPVKPAVPPFQGGNELPADLKGNRLDQRMSETAWAGDPKAHVVGTAGSVVGTTLAPRVRMDNLSAVVLVKVR